MFTDKVYGMSYQLNIFLLLFGLLQGGLIGLFLFRKRVKDLSFLYLTLILTVTALQMTFKLVSKVWMYENIQVAYLMSYKLPFLIGPLLFLFIKSHVNRVFERRDLLHFIPFAILLMVGLLPNSAFARLIWPSMYTETMLKTISLIFYVLLSWKLVQTNPDRLKKFTSFLVGVTLTELAVIAGLALLFMYYPVYTAWRFLFVPLTLFVYWISFKMMSEPDYFFEARGTVAFISRPSTPKYNHSGLKEDEAQKIFLDLQKTLKDQKPYLDSTLTLDSLAKQVGTSKHYLSQIINMRFGQSFGELINDNRLAEVQQRLTNPKMNHFTIASIALDCGFSSISGFNEVFKKKLGLTPSKYREARYHQRTA